MWFVVGCCSSICLNCLVLSVIVLVVVFLLRMILRLLRILCLLRCLVWGRCVCIVIIIRVLIGLGRGWFLLCVLRMDWCRCLLILLLGMWLVFNGIWRRMLRIGVFLWILFYRFVCLLYSGRKVFDECVYCY